LQYITLIIASNFKNKPTNIRAMKHQKAEVAGSFVDFR